MKMKFAEALGHMRSGDDFPANPVESTHNAFASLYDPQVFKKVSLASDLGNRSALIVFGGIGLVGSFLLGGILFPFLLVNGWSLAVHGKAVGFGVNFTGFFGLFAAVIVGLAVLHFSFRWLPARNKFYTEVVKADLEDWLSDESGIVFVDNGDEKLSFLASVILVGETIAPEDGDVFVDANSQQAYRFVSDSNGRYVLEPELGDKLGPKVV